MSIVIVMHIMCFAGTVYAESSDRPYVIINIGNQSVSSIDEAAKDFAKRVYAYSEYTRIEFGATLYKYQNLYYYAYIHSGGPHDVDILISINAYNAVPSGAIYAGYIHTHPNYPYFSEADINIPLVHGGYAYLVTNTCNVLKYDPSTNYVTNICSSFTPDSLSSSTKSSLASALNVTWYGHFENGVCSEADCRNMQWPNDSSTQHGNTVYTWTENHYHSNTESAHYYEYGFKCTHCNTFVYTEWTSGPCLGGTHCITPWSLRDEPVAS